jgi:hypothetical protein
VRGSRGVGHRHRAWTVILAELFDFEDLVACLVMFGFLHMRAVELDPVADLDAGGIAFELVNLRVAGVQLQPALAGEDAAIQRVMAVLDGDHRHHRDRHCDNSDNGSGNFSIAWADLAARALDWRG